MSFNSLESKAIERLMRGCRLGAKVYHYDILESTQVEAKRLAREKTPGGTLVIARSQTKGYGRQGAFWHSAPGGLWFSIVLYPKFVPTQAEAFSLKVVDVIKKTLEDFCPNVKFTVKPPNDILAEPLHPSKLTALFCSPSPHPSPLSARGGSAFGWEGEGRVRGSIEDSGLKKVCGILAEGEIQGNSYEWLILGVGINVDNDLPNELKAQAANLKELSGQPTPRMPLLKKLLEDLTTLR